MMTEFEYIKEQCRKYHFMAWNEDELNYCRQLLPALSRNELLSIYRNRRLGDRHPLKDAIFKILFADKIGKREERIHTMNTDSLIQEFAVKNSGNRALIRKEMQLRYKKGDAAERSKIEHAFNAATKSDRKWIKNKIKR